VSGPAVIGGHPEVPLLDERGNVSAMLTVCAECGGVHTIILLTGDRWYCSACRVKGINKPKMFPIS